MDATYILAKLDFDALDEKLQRFVKCRNELAMLAVELGDIAQKDLLLVTLEKGPTCSGSCKQGEKG